MNTGAPDWGTTFNIAYNYFNCFMKIFVEFMGWAMAIILSVLVLFITVYALSAALAKIVIYVEEKERRRRIDDLQSR